MAIAVGMVSNELAVVPERFKMGLGLRVHRGLPALSEFRRPLEAPGHGSLGQIGTADIHGAESAVAFENPCLRMQPRPAAVERYAHFAPRQAGQLIQCLCFGSTDIRRGQYPQPCPGLPIAPDGGDALQDVANLADAPDCNEAHQDVHAIAAAQLVTQFIQQRWR